MIAKLLGRTGATAGQDFVIEDRARIGASPENDVRIAAPGVSRRHAKISREGEQYWLEDAGATNGTFLNGSRIARETLRHLDIITLGRAVDLIFVFRANETAPAVVERIRNVKIEITDGPDAGTSFDVSKGEMTIGRAPSCNVVLASPAISKVHARLERSANQVLVQDLQSANGTFVNGQRVDSVAALGNGDVLNFAGVRSVRITIEGVAGAAPVETAAPPVAPTGPAFNQEWKTRFVWAPEELEQIEAARREAVALMSVRGSKAEAAKPAASPAAAAAAARPVAPAGPKPATPAPASPAGLPGREPSPADAKSPAPPVQKPAAPPAAAPAAAVKPAPPEGAAKPAAPEVAVKPVAAEVAAKPAAPAVPVKPAAGEVAAKPAAPAAAAAPPAPAVTAKTPAPPPPAAAKPPAPAAPPAPVVTAAPPAPPVVAKPPAPPTPAVTAKPPAQEVAAKPPSPAAPAVAKPVAPPAPAPPTPASGPDARTIVVRPPDEAVTMPSLKAPVIRGARLLGAGAPIELGLGTFTVGRGIDSDVRLDDRQVSRAHAKIVIDATAVTVEDLKTVNGTFVNGREVKAREPLSSGDVVRFGAVELKLEVITS